MTRKEDIFANDPPPSSIHQPLCCGRDRLLNTIITTNS